jgi:iron complex outermembrane recepter protein
MFKRLGAWILLCWTAVGQAQPVIVSAARDLADLSLEQLSNVVVSSVSGRPEPLSRAPASVYVITGEDIRRSGAVTLPEALRLAPNLQIARIDSGQYAITARGFNSTIANKLLVLIDGRTVYTPLFSGTFWEVQDVMLEDVERIEVISGPGATLWGANAVNGVINVITRPAADTRGGLATLGGGSIDRQGAVRYGGELTNGGHYRLYAKGARREASTLPGGAAVRDRAEHLQTGFRADWDGGRDGFTLQGDLYARETDQVPGARELGGVNLLGRWTRDLGEGERLRVQAYYDRTTRNQPGSLNDQIDTVDVEMHHNLRQHGAHRVLWGLGVRRHADNAENIAAPALAFLPAYKVLLQSNVFLQDEISITPELDLTLGAKLDRNTYTGTEFLPSARLAWRHRPGAMVWSALSRAVRAPARLDREFFIPGVAGGPDFRSEVSRVFELGYRAQAGPSFSWSATAFYHDHDRQRSLAPVPGGTVIANDLEGHTSGVEGWASWRVSDRVRLHGGLTRLSQSLNARPGTVDLQARASVGSDPNGWWRLGAAFDLGSDWELDLNARHYGALSNRSVPAYTAVDARLGWHLSHRVELSVLVQNLFDQGHVEWLPGAELRRAAFLKARISF